LEKIFYNFFLQKFFEKYDVLERAISNCNQFLNKKDKKDVNQDDVNELYDNNLKNVKNIEYVKLQIENILKYIYHESEKNNLSFICKSLIKFCNEKRIVLIEEKTRRSTQPKYNYINKRDLNEENSVESVDIKMNNEENSNLKMEIIKDMIKYKEKIEGKHLNILILKK